ncbi:glutathione S-transferase family protein [Rhodovibrionaceae bacterium A322]
MYILGRDLSPFARRCIISMKILGIDFERKELNTALDFDKILAENPVGRVPALILDDGRGIYDSAAILDWIDQQVGTERALIPLSGDDRVAVMGLVSLATSTMEKNVGAVYEVHQRPAEKVHADWLNRLERQTSGGFAALEAALGDKTYFHGDRLTQADISVAVLYDFTTVMNAKLLEGNPYPKLAAHLERMKELPAFQETDLAPFRPKK